MNSSIINDNEKSVRLSYDPVDLWKTKHHYYYLENKLEYLNSENEWYFDNNTKYLYVRLFNDAIPKWWNIHAKVKSYSLNIQKRGVKVRNINFFGTTFRAKNAMNINITNCNFWYQVDAHMLGEINRGSPINTINDEKFETNTNVKNYTGCIIEMCFQVC